MTETHRHCQCDNCSGIDCGQDDPEAHLKSLEDNENRIRAEAKREEREAVLDELAAKIGDGLESMPDFIIPEVRKGKIDTCEWVLEKINGLRQSEAK
jgi:hypothetical protein